MEIYYSALNDIVFEKISLDWSDVIKWLSEENMHWLN